ncbi:hypothetical protein [Methylobacterium sp. 88A]|uniref:hypothetical protein n=1 Tax=Methylobacterium sp. 88A TaxID=1131813 RepID=UPI00035F880E|nr:hypothetical protein [Methylobacterium sp. 88A]
MPHTTPLLPPYVHPPAWLGLQWQPGELLHTRRGPRYLSRAPRTPEFDEAIDQEVICFWDLGLTREGREVLFWQAPDHDLAAVQAAIDSIPAQVAAREAERAAAAAERRAREEAEAAALREKEAAFIAHARAEAEHSLKKRRWSWARRVDVDEAQGLLDKSDFDAVDAKRLLTMVKRAAANVQRSEDKVALLHPPEQNLAALPVVRNAALAAVRLITADDQDRAMVQNNIGWSKSTTIDGHVLAALPSLDVAQASHALRLLRVHQKQLPRAVVERIFAAA